MALTSRKRLFAEAKIRGKTNKDAACEAGYSEKTASAAGSRLVKDADVKKYIAAHKKAGGKSGSTSNPAPKEVAAEPPTAEDFDVSKAFLYSDPKAYLLMAMNDPAMPPKERVNAAKALLPFMHKRLGEGGKKEEKDAAAKGVASRFAAAAPPRLAAAGGKKV
jgi:phage terminase small subunit